MSNKGQFNEYDIDDCICAPKPNEKLYIFRAPLDFDWSMLHGKKLNLSTNAEPIKISSGTGHSLIVDTNGQPRLRAIVTNDLINEPCVGPKFEGSILIHQDWTAAIPLPLKDAPVPVNAYRKVPQVEGLRIRSMPRGSTTPIEYVWGDDAGGERGGRGTKTKAATVVIVDDDNDPDEVAVVDRKRQKKEKKEKKEKRERER